MNTLDLPFSIKSISDTGVIEGVISAFGGVDSYGDSVARGAYRKSLAAIAESGRKLPVLYQHDATRPLGVWAELRETDQALIGRAELALEVRDAQEALALARKGALTGMSIGYKVPPGGSKLEGNKRVLMEIELIEASLVTFPADPKARVTAIKGMHDARDIADLFQEQFGISGRRAKAAAGAAWKVINEQVDNDAAEAVLRGALARLANL